MTSQFIEKDIAIIGAGPAGMFTVFEAGFLGYSCALIDSLGALGGQPGELYPEKPIYDIPAHPKLSGRELVQKLEQQISPYNPEILLNSPVSEFSRDEDGTFTLQAGEHNVKAKVVVIAAGGGMFTPRKPPLKQDFSEFENKSLFYSVRNTADFANKNVVIAGGGDSAVDWANELSTIAKHVHIIHRRPDFRAVEDSVKKMYEIADTGKITIHTSAQMAEIIGTNGEVSAVSIKTNEGSSTQVDADNVLCFFGLLPNLGALENWGLDMAGKKIAVDRITMKTSADGVLAIGDIADYEGKISLILCAFAEAATAAKTAQSIIDPDKKFKVVYSSSQGVPEK